MKPSSRWTTGRILLIVARLGLAAIFLAAAYGKLRPQSAVPYTFSSLRFTPASLRISMTFFAMQVASYKMLPAGAVSPFAHTLPWVELALGVLLLSGSGLRYVAVVSTVLLAIFWAVVIRSYAMHLAINCGCFGPNEKLGAWTIVRDGLFFGLGLALTIGAFLVHRRRAVRTSSLSQGELSVP